MFRGFVFISLVIFCLFPFSGDTFTEAEIILLNNEEQKAEIFSMVQFWGVASLESSQEENIDSRFDMYIRRGRIGLKGSFHHCISYYTCFAYDNLGKDRYTRTYSSPQTDDNLKFYLWDLYFTMKQSDSLNVTLGYFRPQIGRESITSAFNVNSFTKTLANSYVRSHIVGHTPGRETGLNIGGNYRARYWDVNYNIGVFDTNHHAIAGGSALYLDSTSGPVTSTPYYGGDRKWSLLFAARVALSLGEPEMTSYKLGYQINYFGKRKGVTVAANGTHQDEMVPFNQNNLYGGDLLINYVNFNLDAEYDVFARELPDGRNYHDRVFHLRMGYNILLKSGHYLEPVFLYSDCDIAEISTLGKNKETLYSGGVNLYLDENKWKINLHYGVRQLEEVDYEFIAIGCQFIY